MTVTGWGPLPDATALGVGALARRGGEGLAVADALWDGKPAAAVYGPRIPAGRAAEGLPGIRAAVTALRDGTPA
jgi:hypothetical protein